MPRLPFASSIEHWSAARRFHALPAEARRIVFYAEDGDSWPHLGPIVRELSDGLGRQVCYLTSSHADPVLKLNHPLITPFCIGEGAVRTSLFMSLKADVCIMTMPDLQTFHLKRSWQYPVHYVYVFHSMVSTHMIYRKGAFDAFDTILCTGPHHLREIRATEAAYNLPPKQLIEHGYSRLDTIRTYLTASPRGRAAGSELNVLLAPSWGPSGLIETRGAELCHVLLDAGCRVTVRPHPMTRRKWPAAVQAIQREFADNAFVRVETDITSSASLDAADVMIGDWSGAALEYAFGYERPVLFVDVPRKVNNPEYERIDCEPLEVSIRERIGRVVAPERLAELVPLLRSLPCEADDWAERIRAARTEYVYNLGRSARVAAEAIVNLSEEKCHAGSAHELCCSAS